MVIHYYNRASKRYTALQNIKRKIITVARYAGLIALIWALGVIFTA